MSGRRSERVPAEGIDGDGTMQAPQIPIPRFSASAVRLNGQDDATAGEGCACSSRSAATALSPGRRLRRLGRLEQSGHPVSGGRAGTDSKRRVERSIKRQKVEKEADDRAEPGALTLWLASLWA